MGIQLKGEDLARLRHRLDVEFHKPFPIYNWLVNHEQFPSETRFFVDRWPRFKAVLARTEIQNRTDYFVLFVNTTRPASRLYDHIPGSYLNVLPETDSEKALSILCTDPAVIDWKRHVVFDYVDSSLWFLLESSMRVHGGAVLNKQEPRYVYTCTADTLLQEPPPEMAKVVMGQQPEDHQDLAKCVFVSSTARPDYRVLLRDKRTSCCLLNEAETSELTRCMGLASATLLGDFVLRTLMNLRPGEENAYLPIMYSLVACCLFGSNTQPAFTLPVSQRAAEHLLLTSLGFTRMTSDKHVVRVRRYSSFVDQDLSRPERDNVSGRLYRARRVLDFNCCDPDLDVCPSLPMKDQCEYWRDGSSVVFRRQSTGGRKTNSRSSLEIRRANEELRWESRRRNSAGNMTTQVKNGRYSLEGKVGQNAVTQGKDALQFKRSRGLSTDCTTGIVQVENSDAQSSVKAAIDIEHPGWATPNNRGLPAFNEKSFINENPKTLQNETFTVFPGGAVLENQSEANMVHTIPANCCGENFRELLQGTRTNEFVPDGDPPGQTGLRYTGSNLSTATRELQLAEAKAAPVTLTNGPTAAETDSVMRVDFGFPALPTEGERVLLHVLTNDQADGKEPAAIEHFEKQARANLEDGSTRSELKEQGTFRMTLRQGRAAQSGNVLAKPGSTGARSRPDLASAEPQVNSEEQFPVKEKRPWAAKEFCISPLPKRRRIRRCRRI